MTDIANIRELEDQRWAAQIGADIAALDTLLADELSYTHSNGMVDTKTSYLAAIEKRVFDYQSEQRTDVEVTIIGSTAMVTGRVEMTVVAGGREVHLDSRYSAIWVERNGDWRFLCWQSTPLP